MKKSQRTGWYKPYQWVMVPHTVYERRRELRVREARQTAIVWDKRQFNIDTMKFDTNTIKTLNSISLCDLMDLRNDGDYNFNRYQCEIPIFRRKDDFD